MPRFKYNDIDVMRDKHDTRDHVFTAFMGELNPPKVDLRTSGKVRPHYDQGRLGSCTANAVLGAEWFVMSSKGKVPLEGSRLAQYYWSRSEVNKTKDSGASLRDAFSTLTKNGVAPETTWAYNIRNFAKEPPLKAFISAISHRTREYQRLQGIQDIESALAANHPVVIGVPIYASFESRDTLKTGVVPIPKTGERFLGGHAMLVVGYDQEKQVLIIRNSWGTRVGDGGDFYLPYAYLERFKRVSDAWTLISI